MDRILYWIADKDDSYLQSVLKNSNRARIVAIALDYTGQKDRSINYFKKAFGIAKDNMNYGVQERLLDDMKERDISFPLKEKIRMKFNLLQGRIL